MRPSRREFLTGSTTALVAGAFAPALVRGWQQPPPTPLFTNVRRNVGTFTMRGGTIGYLINPSGVVVVDSQFMAEAAECKTHMKNWEGNNGYDGDDGDDGYDGYDGYEEHAGARHLAGRRAAA